MILLDWLTRGGIKVEIKNEPRQEVLDPTLQKQAKEIIERKQGLGGYKQKTWGEIAFEKKAAQVCQEAGHPLTLSGYCLIEDCPYMFVQLKCDSVYYMNTLSRHETEDYLAKVQAWKKSEFEKKNKKATPAQKAAILRKLSKDNDAIAFLYEHGWESAELNNAVVEQLCEAGHWEIAELFDEQIVENKSERLPDYKAVAQALVEAKNKKKKVDELKLKKKIKRSFEEERRIYEDLAEAWKKENRF